MTAEEALDFGMVDRIVERRTKEEKEAESTSLDQDKPKDE